MSVNEVGNNEAISENVEKARRLLSNVLYRPQPSEVKGLTFEDIDEAAQLLGYPIIDHTRDLQLVGYALTVIAQKLKSLLMENEANKPIYLFFGRDCDFLYDALASSAEGSEIISRLKLISFSYMHAQSAVGTARDWLNAKQLFAQEGVGKDVVQRGQSIVLADTGFRGSVFDMYANIIGLSDEEVDKYVVGRLIAKRGGPKEFAEILTGSQADQVRLFDEFYESYIKVWLQDNPSFRFIFSAYEGQPVEKKLNLILCCLLQILPKHCAPSDDVIPVDGMLHSVPEQKNRVYPNQLSIQKQSGVPGPNSSIQDPVRAMKTQIVISNYFSRPEVKRWLLEN